MIAASLLSEEPVVLDNVPRIGDVLTMVRIACALGVSAEWQPEQGRLVLCASCLTDDALPRELCGDVRAGILFAAPLLHRCGRAAMYPPGGDVIGRRRLDAHFAGLRALGATIDVGERFGFSAPGSGLRGGDCFLPEASVTATEQLLMAAVLARGTTVIRNAACEPNVQDLGRLLRRMGARISGLGTNELVVEGVERLHGAQCRVAGDPIEAGSFLALGAATGGDVTVTGVVPDHFRMVTRVFERLGIGLEMGPDWVRVGAEQRRAVQPDLMGGIPVVDDGIWPQFPSDLMSVCIVMSTQVSGTVLFFEKLYESRMYFVDRLISMGANAVICDPHRVVVSGPSRLHGIELTSPDIRAGIALVGAALCAEGRSVIHNIRLIDRGYERIDAKLLDLGARITRFPQCEGQ
jgi:UDP-N-acetylglucosamine 1-carboxyvinyltransferase